MYITSETVVLSSLVVEIYTEVCPCCRGTLQWQQYPDRKKPACWKLIRWYIKLAHENAKLYRIVRMELKWSESVLHIPRMISSPLVLRKFSRPYTSQQFELCSRVRSSEEKLSLSALHRHRSCQFLQHESDANSSAACLFVVEPQHGIDLHNHAMPTSTKPRCIWYAYASCSDLGCRPQASKKLSAAFSGCLLASAATTCLFRLNGQQYQLRWPGYFATKLTDPRVINKRSKRDLRLYRLTGFWVHIVKERLLNTFKVNVKHFYIS